MSHPRDTSYDGMSVGELLCLYAIETAQQLADDPEFTPDRRAHYRRDRDRLQVALAGEV